MMPLRTAGNAYVKGLGVTANSSVAIALNGAYTNFLAALGLDAGASSGSSVVFQVLADNTTIYTSPTMTVSSGAVQVNLNVAGVHVLYLVVTAVAGNPATAYADWGNAQLSPAGVTFATSLPYQLQGLWHIGINANSLGGPIMLNGVEYQQGFGEAAPSGVLIQLNGKYSTFKATIGVDSLIGTLGSICFRVMAGYNTIYTSPLMTAQSAALSISINVKNVQALKLVNDQGDGRTARGDYGDWALPELFP
jgi:hypothetical protein